MSGDLVLVFAIYHRFWRVHIFGHDLISIIVNFIWVNLVQGYSLFAEKFSSNESRRCCMLCQMLSFLVFASYLIYLFHQYFCQKTSFWFFFQAFASYHHQDFLLQLSIISNIRFFDNTTTPCIQVGGAGLFWFRLRHDLLHQVLAQPSINARTNKNWPVAKYSETEQNEDLQRVKSTLIHPFFSREEPSEPALAPIGELRCMAVIMIMKIITMNGEDKFSLLCSLWQLSQKEEIQKISAKREGSDPPSHPSNQPN